MNVSVNTLKFSFALLLLNGSEESKFEIPF